MRGTALITVAYMLEIIVAELMLLAPFEKRKQFAVRMGVSVLACLAIAAIVPDNPFEQHSFLYVSANFLKFFLLFSISVTAMYLCFQSSLWSVLSMCTAGYAMQHITQRIYVIVSVFLPIFEESLTPAVMLLRELGFFTPFYLIYSLWCRKIQRTRQYEADARLNAISIAIIILCMVVTRVQDFGPATGVSKISNALYAVLCCVSVLVLQFYVRSMNAREQEYQMIKHLYAKEKEEYKHWQSSIDVINIKCHDLKHRIGDLRHHYSEKQIREIEDSVMIYDSALNTGNKVLDIILFEKNVFCEKNKIEFSYMINGDALNFVRNDELFALFSNIIDNAIEAVMDVEEDKRIIQLTVKEAANMVLIFEENYFTGSLEIADGYPVTKKADKEQHGFGVRSIRRFSEDYNGSMRFQTQDDVFSLTICIPKQKNNDRQAAFIV